LDTANLTTAYSFLVAFSSNNVVSNKLVSFVEASVSASSYEISFANFIVGLGSYSLTVGNTSVSNVPGFGNATDPQQIPVQNGGNLTIAIMAGNATVVKGSLNNLQGGSKYFLAAIGSTNSKHTLQFSTFAIPPVPPPTTKPKHKKKSDVVWIIVGVVGGVAVLVVIGVGIFLFTRSRKPGYEELQ